MKRRGFTIVELLMVIGILAVLLTIVTTAASESMRAARKRRADASKTVVQVGLAAYHAAKDGWPGDLNLEKKTGNHRLGGNNKDPYLYDLSAEEVRRCVYELVREVKNGNPVIDVTGLWVSRSNGNTDKKEYGLDFMSAIRGTSKSARKMKIAEMYFGYPRASDGGFERFGMGYSLTADMISVGNRGDYPGGD